MSYEFMNRIFLREIYACDYLLFMKENVMIICLPLFLNAAYMQSTSLLYLSIHLSAQDLKWLEI